MSRMVYFHDGIEVIIIRCDKMARDHEIVHMIGNVLKTHDVT